MDVIIGVAIGLFVLVILVVLHELGHAIVARRNGVVVEEFGIGFPPKAWAKKLKNGILFSLNWLPIGGFVKLQGEHDAADQKGDYGAASFWQKTKILLAGVAVNWLVAGVLFSILALFGLPKIIDSQFYLESDTRINSGPVQVVDLTDDFPAAEAGIESGDKILAVEDNSVDSVQEFIDLTEQYRGQSVEVQYERAGQERVVDVELRNGERGVIFGAGLGQSETIQNTWSAPVTGFATNAQLTWEILRGLGDLVGNLVGGFFMQFSPDASTRTSAQKSLEAAGASVAGPVGILGVLFPQAGQAGIGQITLLAAVISLTLAIMNALPIPALDGGRWFTTLIFRLIKKPLTKDLEERIQASGFVFLILLIILVTVADVAKLF